MLYLNLIVRISIYAIDEFVFNEILSMSIMINMISCWMTVKGIKVEGVDHEVLLVQHLDNLVMPAGLSSFLVNEKHISNNLEVPISNLHL